MADRSASGGLGRGKVVRSQNDEPFGMGRTANEVINSDGYGSRSSGGCYKCGEDGHLARDCPTGKSSGGFRSNDNSGEFGSGRNKSGFGTTGGGGTGFGGSGGTSSGGFGSRSTFQGSGGFGSTDGGIDSGRNDCGGFGSSGRDSGARFGSSGRDSDRGGFGGSARDSGGFGGPARESGGGFSSSGRSGGSRFGDSAGDGGFGESGRTGVGGFGSRPASHEFGAIGGFGNRNDARAASFGDAGRNESKSFGSGCRNCGEEGHMARDCQKLCGKCKKEGHISRDCTEPSLCNRCNKAGHMARECPEPAPEGVKFASYKPTDDATEQLFADHINTGINFKRHQELRAIITSSTGTTPAEFNTFEEMGFDPLIVKNIERSKYLEPTPIQKSAIACIMKHRDVMACAQTGSGKTGAFMLPIIQSLIDRADECPAERGDVQKPTVVVIEPTRELARQTYDNTRKYAHDIKCIRPCVIYGGMHVEDTKARFTGGTNILIATVGRLKDWCDKGICSFENLKYLVLDEADRMLDMGFEPDVRRLTENYSMPGKERRQTLMFSATFPSSIQQLAKDFLNPDYMFIAVGIVGGANTDITQEFLEVGKYDKKSKLVEILKADEKNPKCEKTLVFVERRRNADFLATLLSSSSISSTSIHGDRQQSEREMALRDFKSGKCKVLIATAVAARGLDIKGVDHVLNYDLPSEIDDYVHRIGRTGRVGNPGRATSFYDAETDARLIDPLLKILGDAHQDIPPFFNTTGITPMSDRFGETSAAASAAADSNWD